MAVHLDGSGAVAVAEHAPVHLGPESAHLEALAVGERHGREIERPRQDVGARAFGATRTPEAFLFDASGKLVYHGAVDDNAHKPAEVSARWLNDALAATVSGKAVATKETKSLGCTIKFRSRPTSS